MVEPAPDATGQAKGVRFDTLAIERRRQAQQLPRQIGGAFQTLEQAEAAARKAGAIGEGERSGRDLVFDVEGHEGEDDYGIWIEIPPGGRVDVRNR
jgi:hypothetical protein